MQRPESSKKHHRRGESYQRFAETSPCSVVCVTVADVISGDEARAPADSRANFLVGKASLVKTSL